MCGLAGGAVQVETVRAGLAAIAHRGPDGNGIAVAGDFLLGHVRLAVQDLSEESAQPMFGERVWLTYNGELWEPDRLRDLLGGDFSTTGDTEVVLRCLDMMAPTAALRMLDGMFALAWHQGNSLYLARDPYGEIPLHYGRDSQGRFLYASEVKALLAMGAEPLTIQWVEPGTLLRVTPTMVERTTWYSTPWRTRQPPTEEAARQVRTLLAEGVVNRMTADVPVAVLLSGGLDSAATAALLVANGYHPALYTAVRSESNDLRHARRVAAHLRLPLTEVRVPDPDPDYLSGVVRHIEMPHKAQVEIAVGCLALAERLRHDGQVCVLSGEGSDELWASYGMDYHGIQRKGWWQHRVDAVHTQHRKNFARTNKVFMAYGIEARLPFLHPPLVRYGLSLAQSTVTDYHRHPKAVLARAVADLLPEETAWRPKRAFQTEAGIDRACAGVVADPRAFYAAEFRRHFSGARP